MADPTILWRRLDRPGHESARLSYENALWGLSGTAIFAHDEQPCRLDYRVICDSKWQTEFATVTGWVGKEIVAIELAVDTERRWRMNGKEWPQVAGCIDLDLNFSPSTNLLPIRRLDLDIGQEGRVRAAWLRFPGFNLEPLDQIYRRIKESAYRYESGGGKFVTELQVNTAGFVTVYPNFFELQAALTDEF